jgi:flagellar assembly protein FliH
MDTRFPKSHEKIKELPKAQTFRHGSYRLLNKATEAVTVKPVYRVMTDLPRFNATDWFLFSVESAQEEGMESAEAAYYQGLDEGFQVGRQSGLIEVQKNSELLNGTLKNLEESILQFYHNLEGEAVNLALKAAEIIVGQAALDHQDLVKSTVKKAIAEAIDKTKIFVKVNPKDYELLKNARNEVIGLSEGIEHFKIEADEKIVAGSCRVTTPSGVIDADFHIQMAELKKSLQQASEVSP